MDLDRIRREVDRLSPWYYAFDLGGVRTEEGPACDHHGHRRVALPEGARVFLAGKSVLDVGCNEGARTFAALEHGAHSVEAFDVRAINVEKARFVADVLGHRGARFSVASCDAWLAANPGRSFDYVFLCGLLYHLPEPWRTIRDYCARAHDSVYVTCVLAGGDHGYTPGVEIDTIAANAVPGERSMMPNTTETLLDEFAKHGFAPLYAGEAGLPGHWGSCWILLRSCRDFAGCVRRQRPGPQVGIWFVPVAVADPGQRRRPFDVHVVLLNRQPHALPVSASLVVRSRSGFVHQRLGPERLLLPAAYPAGEGTVSLERRLALDLPLHGGESVLEVVLEDARSGLVIDSAELSVPAAAS